MNKTTVKDLIEQLSRFNDDLEVVFAHPSHDYWKTEVVSSVGDVFIEEVVWSSYHGQFKRINDLDIDEDEKVKRVLVLE